MHAQGCGPWGNGNKPHCWQGSPREPLSLTRLGWQMVGCPAVSPVRGENVKTPIFIFIFFHILGPLLFILFLFQELTCNFCCKLGGAVAVLILKAVEKSNYRLYLHYCLSLVFQMPVQVSFFRQHLFLAPPPSPFLHFQCLSGFEKCFVWSF